jgi:hypothetical protein
MIDALIKRISVTYKCYEMYAHRWKKVQLLGNKGKYFPLNSLSYHFSPFENENYHRFIISLQANNLTSRRSFKCYKCENVTQLNKTV